MTRLLLRCGTIAFLLCTPSVAWANAGVPMVVPTALGMGIAFPLVIAIELLVLRITLGVPLGRLLAPVLKANAVSTLFGYPIAWLVLLAWSIVVALLYSALSPVFDPLSYLGEDLELFVVSVLMPAWVAPFRTIEIAAMAMVALPVNLAAAFVVSVRLERTLLQKALDLDVDVLRHPILRAHIMSYAFLLLLGELQLASWAEAS